MAQWIPDPDGVAEAIEKLAADVAGMYATAEENMLRAIAAELRAGIERPGALETSIRLGELRAAARDIVDQLRAAMPETVQAILDAAATGGAAAALEQMASLTSLTDITKRTMWAAGNTAANLLIADLTSTLDQLHLRILRYPDDVYQQVIGMYAANPMITLQTGRQAELAAWREFLRRGIDGFVDKSGRNWNLATYTEMATRTAVRRAWNDGHAAQMNANGMDLVTPIVGNYACEKCGKWTGRILTTGNRTGTREVEHVTQDYVYIRVQVDATVEQARAQGWQHPNCRCTLVAYLPGLTVPMGITTYSKEDEDARERLRALEREVRKTKRDKLLAFSDIAKKAEETKIRGLQAQIREHIEATGLNRKRYREQLNYGHSTK